MPPSKLGQICYGHLLCPPLLFNGCLALKPHSSELSDELPDLIFSPFFYILRRVGITLILQIWWHCTTQLKLACTELFFWNLSVWSGLVAYPRNIILCSGEVLRIVVAFVYSSVGSVLSKKAILLLEALESIPQQRDQEKWRAVLLFQTQAWRHFSQFFFLLPDIKFTILLSQYHHKLHYQEVFECRVQKTRKVVNCWKGFCKSTLCFKLVL